jgi:hypothetical protein
VPDNRPNRPRPTRNRHGAEGAVWRRISAYVARRDYGRCHICTHLGATQADHLEPVTERPDLALDSSNMKAAHGYPNPCPTCTDAALVKGGKPVYCNELRGSGTVERARRIIEARTGLKLGTAEEQQEAEREW